MKIEYKVNAAITPLQMSKLFKASGLNRPAEDLPRLQRMIDHADILITAWDGNHLAGIARAITDFSYCCYLSDLAVDKHYQKSGIGRELTRLVQEQAGKETALLLLSSPIAMEYYPRIGFEKADNAFKIPREK
ncbi:Acetyltransferase (GNAT) domain-containing protein [Bacillus sp. OV322]|uniref:GNAT family N-acetyltransferase n=1 Tax=Bacillus sp. OV322 TaxID=1882764 RepID=UPI0008EFB65C|nr:GNAT family N-acetyltransferase [Bacillus sp. OV322]SFC25505.1 Acetyltransferase (GNAT) domain-containing protein [Bacillus sp. OV322]